MRTETEQIVGENFSTRHQIVLKPGKVLVIAHYLTDVYLTAFYLSPIYLSLTFHRSLFHGCLGLTYAVPTSPYLFADSLPLVPTSRSSTSDSVISTSSSTRTEDAGPEWWEEVDSQQTQQQQEAAEGDTEDADRLTAATTTTTTTATAATQDQTQGRSETSILRKLFDGEVRETQKTLYPTLAV